VKGLKGERMRERKLGGKVDYENGLKGERLRIRKARGKVDCV